ncbi:hypothetical protein ACE1B6_14125 [Aerosakkonemataceae cyanobacterium BLCC-F154]|uniref:Ribbon-helix-helix protein CopG domain-containing protein n=1 Tax=Floridaenema fluviatile BLCC-F154 TaxID=3153640 RepID=A0ABV4YCZ4_9CYAN
MGEKIKVSCKIPQEWEAKIELLAKERKTQTSKIIYEALAQYLGENANTDDSRLNALEVEVTMLKRQLAELTILIKNQQPNSLVKLPKVQTNVDDDDDFIEDEPDEILYDFLPPEER